MNHSRIFIICTVILLLLVCTASSATAQMENNQGSRQGQGLMTDRSGHSFGQMDDRFDGFGTKTLAQVCSEFGISVNTAISDLGLPENTDPQMTIEEITQNYQIQERTISSYMLMHMRRMNPSVNAREMVEMRQQAIQQMRSQGKVHGLQFMTRDHSAYGNFTTFKFNESGQIIDFAISGDMIFDWINISDFGYRFERIQGPNAQYVGNSSIIQLHDNPSAITQIKALDDITVEFNLGEDVEANLTDSADGTPIIQVTKNNFVGYLIFGSFLNKNQDNDINVDITDNSVIVSLVNNTQVIFRATPMPPQFLQTQYNYSNQFLHMHQRINHGIATGMVGAEVAFRNGGNSSSIVNYTPLKIQTKEAIRNRLALEVQSELNQSQIVTLDVDNETINLTDPQRIRLRYDGEQVKRTDNIDELFTGNNEPLWNIMHQNNTATMAVYIPEFSVHEIIIDVVEPSDKPAEHDNEDPSTPGFESLFAITVLAVAYRKWKSKT